MANLPLFGLFDDYKAFGMDFGYRQYLGSAVARPYVGVFGGFVRLDQNPERIQRPGCRRRPAGVNMYESSTVPSLGVVAACRLILASGSPSRVASSSGGRVTPRTSMAWPVPVSSRSNDESSRWSMPVTGGVTVRF